MPAPATTLGIFEAAEGPTAHAVPHRAGLCWLQIGHDQPHFLIALVPARQQRALQAARLLAETVHLATPRAAHAEGCAGQTAKLAFPLRTEIALFVDAHEGMPPQRDDLAVEPGGVQA